MPIYEKKKIMYEINKFESGKGGWYVVRVMHVHVCKKKIWSFILFSIKVSLPLNGHAN